MRRGMRIVPIAIVGLIVLFQYFRSEKFENPETHRKSRMALSTKDEAALGLQSYREVLSQSEVINSGSELEQVVRVAKRLAAATKEPFEWGVSLVRSEQANAFCLPGGKIVVYMGILPLTKTDGGLAAVMGHEMAHATSRHGSERLLKDSIAQTALAGASLSFGDMEPRKRYAIMAALGAGAQFGILLPFSRNHESEADAIGLMYMARAGYDPRESIEFWQRMSEQSKGGPPEFMSTHPSHGTRIQRLQDEMPKAMEEYQKAKK